VAKTPSSPNPVSSRVANSSEMMMRHEFKGHITPEDKARSDYRYVPFELTAAAQSLTVRYRYSDRITADKTEGGNVIDIGIFDPRGADFPGGPGFRGWSGSNRAEFTIGTSGATPGYIPGPLPAGRYQIVLGLYRICSKGADYVVEIEVVGEGDATLQPAATSLAASTWIPRLLSHDDPASPASLWLRGDLQCHSNHSDAKGSLDQLIGKARAAGLDFLAVTDHNTISGHPYLPALAGDDLVLIPGQEVTTYYGHMNVWGTSRWCDFRCRTDEQIAAIIELAHAGGGLCSINHPGGGDLAWGYTTDLPVDSFEIWNGPWPNYNSQSLAMWDSLLQRGRRLPAVGGSDYHCAAGEETGFVRLGQPTTWVKATGRSEAAVLAAIRHGRVCVSAIPSGARLDLRATAAGVTAEMGGKLPLRRAQPLQLTVAVLGGAGYSLRLITEKGVVHETPIDTTPASTNAEIMATRYVRAELVGDMPSELLPANAPEWLDLRGWRWAVSNPIYIQ
jgi:predicted metal-dependent phosphoesterase TrpH